MRPILFQLGPVPFRSYGVMLMIGFLLGLYRAVRAAKRRGMDAAGVVDVCLYSLLAGIVGSRLIFILLNWSEFRGNMGDILSVWQGGLSFHGGILFALGATYAYARAKRIPFMTIADLLAPSVAIGYAVTRIGCFLNGCCYGVPTSVVWGVQFPNVDELARHPTQLYSAAASFLIYLALVRVEKAERPRGYVFAAYLALYSVYRFSIEFLRKGTTADVLVLGLTQAQIASVVICIGAVFALWRMGRRETVENSGTRRS